MGPVSTYTSAQQIIDDAQCQQILRAADKSLTAGASRVYAVVFQPDFAGVAARWVSTGKQQTHVVDLPYGYVLLAVLAFLAERGMLVTQMTESEEQCLVEAILPGNLLTTEGRILVAVRPDGQRVYIDAAANVPGQMYDWGRVKRTLAKLFDTIDTRGVTFHERDL